MVTGRKSAGPDRMRSGRQFWETFAKTERIKRMVRTEMRRGHKAISASQCKYHPSIVTFLDVLGFREIVKQRAPQDVVKLLASVRQFSAPRRKVPRHAADEPQAIIFSDSVIRVRQIDSTDNLRFPSGVVFNELLNLLHAQGELMMEGVLLRGAVALGDVFIQSGQVFGPALVDAYDLQSQFARYPRIVVSPALLRAMDTDSRLKSFHNKLEDEKEHIRALIRRGDDGMWFIDYLRAIESEVDEPELYVKFIESHRDLIRSGSTLCERVSNIAMKYCWLSHYHNEVIRELSDEWFIGYGVAREDLQIGKGDLPIFYDL